MLRLNGIPTTVSDGLTGEGFFRGPSGDWRPIIDDGLSIVATHCVRIHDALAGRIFGDLDYYYSLLPMVPVFLSTAGMNSESPLGRDMFEKFLQEVADFPELNRFLYLYDCRMLVSAIQECTKEVSQLTAEFYRILNLEPFFPMTNMTKDEVRWSTSPIVTNLFAILGTLFIRMHSLLDYLAKLAREAQALRTDFSAYPRLSSANFLFGQRGKLKINGRAGSLFESCEEVAEVEVVRNLLIHDGLLDDIPKAYEVIRGGAVVERFVLMPDRKDGQFERFKNRRLFYGREDRINLRLISLVRNFQMREAETLNGIWLGLVS